MERNRKVVSCLAVVVLLGAGCGGTDETARAPRPDPTPVAVEEPDATPPLTPMSTDTPPPAETPLRAAADVAQRQRTCDEDLDPDQPGPIGQERPPEPELPGSLAAFDSESGVIVMVTRGETWSFDVCANTWTEMARFPDAASAGAVVYDADSDLTVIFAFGASGAPAGDLDGVWAYDVDEDSWSTRTAIDSVPDGEFSPALHGAIHDPVSGLVVTPAPGGRYGTYDVDSDRWDTVTIEASDIHSAGDVAILIGYHPQTDHFIQWARPMTLVNLRDRSVWFDDDAKNPELIYGWPPPPILTAHDPIRGLGIIHTLGGGELHAYDPAIPGWTVLYGESHFPAGPYNGIRSYDAMVYDTINERLVVIGGPFRARCCADGLSSRWLTTDDVWALDTTSGAWTQLLEPSAPET